MTMTYELTTVHSYRFTYYTVYGGSIVLLAVRLSSSSVDVCNTPRRNVTQQGAASGEPVVLSPIRATPCLIFTLQQGNSIVTEL